MDEFKLDVAATEFNNAPVSAVLYTVQCGATPLRDLHLAHVAPNGLVIGSPQPVPVNANESVLDANVVGLPNGNRLVTYTAQKLDPVTGKVENFVRYRVYDDLTGPCDAAPAPGNDALPALAAPERNSDGFVFAT